MWSVTVARAFRICVLVCEVTPGNVTELFESLIGLLQQMFPPLPKAWYEFGLRTELEVVVSKDRMFTSAVMSFVDELGRRWPNTTVTVIIPEMYVAHWWQHLLHNQSTLALKARLLFRRGTVVTSIPYGPVPAPS